MPNYAVILAGGTGTRFGGDTPKQFVVLSDGKPVIVHTLEKFVQREDIEKVVLAVLPNWLDQCRRYTDSLARGREKVVLCEGGATRQQSVYNSLKVLTGVARESDVVLIHDAVRPFVSDRIVSDCIRVADKYGACDVVLGNPDTIVGVQWPVITDVLPRESIYRGQTPQGFKFGLLMKAHEKALADGIVNSSDDVRLVMNLGYQVRVVMGEERNFKITFEEDIVRANAYLSYIVPMPSQIKQPIGTLTAKEFLITEPWSINSATSVLAGLGPDEVLVTPTYLSVCAADLRYFTGTRPQHVLRNKLPLIPIHEAVGRVLKVSDESRVSWLEGRRVLLVPLVPCEDYRMTSQCPLANLAEHSMCHICYRSKFMSSDIPGFLRTAISIPSTQVIEIPDGVPDKAAVLTELMSVSCAALKRVGQLSSSDLEVLILGAGSLAYCTAMVLNYVFQVNFLQMTVCEFPDRSYRLQRFPDAVTKLVLGTDENPAPRRYPLVIDCVGGRRVQESVSIGLDCLHPGGTLVELGVTDDPIPIDNRRVLDNGLRILGSSRSTRDDFEICLSAIHASEELRSRLQALVYRTYQIHSETDVKVAFTVAAEQYSYGKIILDLTGVPWDPIQ